jgi:hypothetical protein
MLFVYICPRLSYINRGPVRHGSALLSYTSSARLTVPQVSLPIYILLSYTSSARLTVPQFTGYEPRIKPKPKILTLLSDLRHHKNAIRNLRTAQARLSAHSTRCLLPPVGPNSAHRNIYYFHTPSLSQSTRIENSCTRYDLGCP